MRSKASMSTITSLSRPFRRETASQTIYQVSTDRLASQEQHQSRNLKKPRMNIARGIWRLLRGALLNGAQRRSLFGVLFAGGAIAALYDRDQALQRRINCLEDSVAQNLAQQQQNFAREQVIVKEQQRESKADPLEQLESESFRRDVQAVIKELPPLMHLLETRLDRLSEDLDKARLANLEDKARIWNLEQRSES